MKNAAKKAWLSIVMGDTKVVERGKCDKIFNNTSGIGVISHGRNINPTRVTPGDAIIINGNIADHGITIISTRENIGFETDLMSDTASLNDMIENVLT